MSKSATYLLKGDVEESAMLFIFHTHTRESLTTTIGVRGKTYLIKIEGKKVIRGSRAKIVLGSPMWLQNWNAVLRLKSATNIQINNTGVMNRTYDKSSLMVVTPMLAPKSQMKFWAVQGKEFFSTGNDKFFYFP